MRYQLRMYTPKAGALEPFVAEWRERVLPLRRDRGFEVLGPWITDDGRFVWIVGHEHLEAANEAYYASPERAAFDPDPVRHLDEVLHWEMSPC